MEAVGADWLQYGALGLLAIVLIAAGILLRERSKQDIELRTRQERFLQQLVEENLQDRREQTESWKRIVEGDIQAREELVSAMKRINESMQRSCDLQEARHGEIIAAINSKGNRAA